MKIKTRGEWICVVIALIIVIMACLWCIDISVSAMLAGGVLSNGFLLNNPAQMYHIGIYGIILSTMLLSFICIHIIVDVLDKKKE